jgi:hypothetical protein
MTRSDYETGMTVTGDVGAWPRVPIHLGAEAASPLGAL